ncbi:hypothetical protein SAMN05446037_105016 [Anaerovirgula multivorans]|uniref:Uncharacterized protein n=1 Tax=Anaerovirgula multivorans TaxID=312168 RepID=A0A239KMU4_9FIRM|nr:hypothetical protein [Anaerovirgula multivorans]SNT19330.1 hypothetical protein SAMN05446037_105016 [Anaerovirgula multivorans]
MMNNVKKTNEVNNVKSEGKIDFSKFLSPKSESNYGVLQLVNSDNGKRIVVMKEPQEKLGSPKQIQILLGEDSILIGTNLPNTDKSFEVKKGGTIYAAKLVGELTDKYNLDFTGKTSMTFYDFEYLQHGEDTILAIKMNQD